MTTFNEACFMLENARAEKAIAERKVLEAEMAVLALVDKKDEGSITHSDDDYKVTVTYGKNRVIDKAELPRVAAIVGTPIFDRVFVPERKLSVGELKYFRDNEPEIYQTLAEALTTKPAKPNVKLEIRPRVLAEVA